LAICFAVFAFLNGLQDLFNQQIFDIPVLEGVVFSIFSFGAIVVARGVKTPIFLKKRYLFTVIFFCPPCHGGWMSSEIIYDQQVISSFAVFRAARFRSSNPFHKPSWCPSLVEVAREGVKRRQKNCHQNDYGIPSPDSLPSSPPAGRRPPNSEKNLQPGHNARRDFHQRILMKQRATKSHR